MRGYSTKITWANNEFQLVGFRKSKVDTDIQTKSLQRHWEGSKFTAPEVIKTVRTTERSWLNHQEVPF